MGAESRARRDLLLIGGGHAHALVLKRLAMRAPPELRITLVSPAPFTPYSGMLPGLLAGHYGFEEAHIDLVRLCAWAGVRFLPDTVLAIDPVAGRVRCAARGEIAYDLVSIDVGSQPELDSVPGAREHAIAVKPVARLWERWQRIAAADSERIAIVGGGAGSVEIALAVAHRLRERAPALSLYCGAADILDGYAPATRKVVKRFMDRQGIELHLDHRVREVGEGALHFDAERSATFDSLLWCTGAAAAPWIADGGLPTDERGFMLVDDTLQSTGFSNVFGAGDIATQQRNPRPKAGVYAVRQGPVLAHNLVAFARGERLREHRPQQRFLSLVSLGPKIAAAERNGLGAHGAWAWNWKDRIDRRFMDQFAELPARAMGPMASPEVGDQAPCGGCGAKVGAVTLDGVLDQLAREFPEIVPARDSLDDAAELDTPGPIMQSVDGLRALVDDPWRMGRIAAQHALSDLYASGARPHSALVLLTLPFDRAEILQRDMLLTLRGALSIFAASACRLIGGHSMQGPEFQIAFTVNGQTGGEPALKSRGATAGDALVISKALGTGALFAAHMQQRADGRDIENALQAMERGNAEAAVIALRLGARAVTDVTGFGLAGHLLRMLDGSTAATLDLASLPVLPGAEEAMRAGVFSTLHAPNRAAASSHCQLTNEADAQTQLRGELLFDPQTSGGLLLALPCEKAEVALRALREVNESAALIGHLEERGASQARLCLR